MRYAVLVCLLVVALVLPGCEGERGPAGPQGDPGPQGVPGAVPIFWDDFESGVFSSAWLHTENVGWVIVSDAQGSQYGTKYAASGTIDDRQGSGISISGDSEHGGLVAFFAAVGSQPGHDWLTWSVDGAIIDGISGNINGSPTPWYSFSFPLSPGHHRISWQYNKDGLLNESADRAWLDGVMIMDFATAKPVPPQELPEGVCLWSEWQERTQR